ncbi:MAG TPA: hypothetical protein VFQ61_15605 [Polyangiaceae bacterium]|nr:hypothetical protein [Polyangiaceae bacterium]
MSDVTFAAVFSDVSSANKALDRLEQERGTSRGLSLLMRERTAERELAVGEGAADVDTPLPLGPGALRLASELQPVVSLAPGINWLVAGPLGSWLERVALGSALELSEALCRSGVDAGTAETAVNALRTGGMLVALELNEAAIGDARSEYENFREATVGCLSGFELTFDTALPAAAPTSTSRESTRAPDAESGSELQPSEAVIPLEAALQGPRPEQVGAIPPGEGDADFSSDTEPSQAERNLQSSSHE